MIHPCVLRILALSAVLVSEVFASGAASSAGAAERLKIEVKSSADSTLQPSYLILPNNYGKDEETRPLLVSLHTWSGNLEQRNQPLETAANQRGWIYLFPNFRGRNDHPQACGSKIAQQDILDATDHVTKQYRVDRKRIYLTGVSGGGHMTMLMAGRHPKRWAAASAWVGISDLAAWHKKHADGNYGAMMRKCCGGAPGDSKNVAAEYKARSPLTWLKNAASTPLDIAAGVHDGHKGSVPIRHSLEAFNALAIERGTPVITETEMVQLGRVDGRLDAPRKSDQVTDSSLGREIYLRRQTGPSRVTIFEGGHEGVATAAVDWLAKHSK